MRTRKPAARRGDVQCWHGGPRNAVHQFVGPSNAADCLAAQRAAARARRAHARRGGVGADAARGAARCGVRVGEPLDLADGKWLLNPGAVGAPAPAFRSWWDALDEQAADGAFWLRLDLDRRVATWQRAPYDPAPARAPGPRARPRRRSHGPAVIMIHS